MNTKTKEEILMYVNGAVAALSQQATYPADINLAKRWLNEAKELLENEMKTDHLDSGLVPE